MSNRNSASTVEYSICIDTVNRNTDLYPDTNDVTLELDVAKLRRGTVQMSVGSIELPVPQFTVEPGWKNICFDEGIRIVGTVAGRAISINTPTSSYIAYIPLYLNPIQLLQVFSPTEIRVTTAYPHALAGVTDIWQSSVPISLVGVSVANPLELVLNSSNPGFSIIDATTLSLIVTSTADLVNTTFPNAGFVSAPALPNPTALCEVINAALQLVGFNQGVFGYDGLKSVFSLTTYAHGLENPQIQITTIITGPGEVNLSQCMGFGNNAGTNIRNQSDKWSIVSEYGAVWRASISITPGFYTGDLSGLGSDINIQFNRLNFDAADVLLFSNAVGNSISVPIPVGLYTAETLCLYLTLQMNQLDPLSNANAPSPSANVYLVEWVFLPEEAGCGNMVGNFQFSCNGVFGLEFSNSTGSSIPLRLGFNNLAYRNGPVFTSARSIGFPILGCADTYFPSRNVQILAHSGRRGYRIDPTVQRVVAATVTAASASVYTLTTVAAHGFQLNDVVRISFPVSSLFGVQASVVAVISAFSLQLGVINGLPWPNFAAWPSTSITVSPLVDSSTFNVYFNYNNIPNSRATNHSIYPVILGFDYNDLLSPAPYLSITTAMLEPPAYLLLQVLGLKGSSYIQHNYQGQNLTNILAKVIFFPSFQVQRGFPMSQTFNGSEILTQVQFRWLCPDHTLYQFHERNWSATLEFIVMTEIPVLLCG
jgi:hypothetical protein